MSVYAGIRAISLVVAAYLLPRGGFGARHWSFTQWITTGDWGHYQAIAEHGYTFHPGHLALDSTFAWYPGFPAAADSIAWLPGLGTARAAFIVTVVAGLAAACGLATLGLKLTGGCGPPGPGVSPGDRASPRGPAETGNPRISVLLVALWAAAPGSMVLSMLYSEALFCALAVWVLVALAGRRWLTAGCLTAAAGTVHSTGAALVAAIAVAVLATLIADRRMCWRPVAALLIAPLGLLGYWGYVAWATHRLDGWFWIEKQTCHIYFDWGRGTLALLRNAVMNGPIAPVALVLLVAAAAVALTAWSLTERIPAALHVYVVAIVVLALGTSANWVGAKPRLLLPAFLLALPLARVLAPLRTWLLAALIALLAAGSMWFGLYLLVIAKWAP
jgi:hypothetical protein